MRLSRGFRTLGRRFGVIAAAMGLMIAAAPAATAAPAPSRTPRIVFTPADPSLYEFVSFRVEPETHKPLEYSWVFGEGTSTGTGPRPIYRYGSDRDYTVSVTITAQNGRSMTIDQVVPVRTHDIVVSWRTYPDDAEVGQTVTLVPTVFSRSYQETARVDLYKVTPGGDVLLDSRTDEVTGLVGNPTPFPMEYTFVDADADNADFRFRAVATLLSAREQPLYDNSALTWWVAVRR